MRKLQNDRTHLLWQTFIRVLMLFHNTHFNLLVDFVSKRLKVLPRKTEWGSMISRLHVNFGHLESTSLYNLLTSFFRVSKPNDIWNNLSLCCLCGTLTFSHEPTDDRRRLHICGDHFV